MTTTGSGSGVDLPTYQRIDGWWESGQVSLYEQNFEHAGFFPVTLEQIQPGDMIVMQLRAPVPNHAAVYDGDGYIIHHVYGRLSCRELYRDFWREHHPLHHAAQESGMKTVKLYGWLGEKYGKVFHLEIATAAEAVRALCANFPDFKADVGREDVEFAVITGKRNGLSKDQLADPLAGDTLRSSLCLQGPRERAFSRPSSASF